MSYLSFFIADYQERIYDDSLNNTNNEYYGTSLSDNTSINVSLELPSLTLETSSKNKLGEVKLSQENLEILDSIKQFNNESELCCVLTLYYALECAELKDWNNLKHILPILKFPEFLNANFEKWYLSQFISSLCENIDYLKIEWICKLIFNEFLIKNTKSDVGIELIYKFIDKLFNVISSEMYIYLMNCEELKPKKAVSYENLLRYSDDFFIASSISFTKIYEVKFC